MKFSVLFSTLFRWETAIAAILLAAFTNTNGEWLNLTKVLSCNLSSPKESAKIVQTPRAHIARTQDGHLVAVLEEVEGYDSTLFVLQVNGPVSGSFPRTLEGVSVQYPESKNCVTFRVGATNALQFRISDSSGCPSSSEVYEGFGLTRVRNGATYQQFSAALTSGGVLPPVSEITCKCFHYDPTFTYDCDNGGPGANECSVSTTFTVAGVSMSKSCTVKCDDGFIACCNE